MSSRYSAVLFDFDGTLADTAPDLSAAANYLRTQRGLSPLSDMTLRPLASHGARGMIAATLNLQPGDAEFETAREEFLSAYEKFLTRETHLFAGVAALLETLEQQDLLWGIVTNKPERYTTPIVAALQLEQRAAVVVCGDTTPYAKPHPAPLHYAAQQLNINETQCLYVGDDERDIQAARAAGMPCIAAAYGYCATDPVAWQADGIIHHPGELLSWL